MVTPLGRSEPASVPVPTREVSGATAVQPQIADTAPEAAPQAPVPSAAGKAQPAVGAGVADKQDKAQREVLSALKAELGQLASGDNDGVKKALDRAKNLSTRQDIKQALELLSRGIGEHTDFVALVLGEMKTDHFDYGKSDLKAAARQIGALVGVGATDLRRAVNDVHKNVLQNMSTYLDELGKIDLAHDLPLIKRMPEGEALETLLWMGATDLSEAEDWLARVRANPQDAALHKELRSEIAARRANVTSVREDTQKELALQATHRPEKALAAVLLRYPSLSMHVLPELGFRADRRFPDEQPATSAEQRAILRAAREVIEENDHFWRDMALGTIFTAATFVPVVGAAATAGEGGFAVHRAFEAALNARVSAASGLVTRDEAERLDDELTRVTVTSAVAFIFSCFGLPGAKHAAKGLNGLRMGQVLHGVGAELAKHPRLVDAAIGAANATVQEDARKAMAKGDYGQVALIVGFGMLEGVAVGALARNLPKIRSKLSGMLQRTERAAVTASPVAPAATAGSDSSAKLDFVRNQVAHGNGTFDPKVLGRANNPTAVNVPKPKS